MKCLCFGVCLLVKVSNTQQSSTLLQGSGCVCLGSSSGNLAKTTTRGAMVNYSMCEDPVLNGYSTVQVPFSPRSGGELGHAPVAPSGTSEVANRLWLCLVA